MAAGIRRKPGAATSTGKGDEAEGQVNAVLGVTVLSGSSRESRGGVVNFKQHTGLSVSDHLRRKDPRLTIREKFHK